jgi:hypothetical protein
MKSLALHIQSSLDSLHDCLQEVDSANRMVLAQEEADQDPPISSSALDRVVAHCLKAQRELQALSSKVKNS